jgi:hypothetical protein
MGRLRKIWDILKTKYSLFTQVSCLYCISPVDNQHNKYQEKFSSIVNNFYLLNQNQWQQIEIIKDVMLPKGVKKTFESWNKQ